MGIQYISMVSSIFGTRTQQLTNSVILLFGKDFVVLHNVFV